MTRFGSQSPSRARRATALGTLAAPLSLLLALTPERAAATPPPAIALAQATWPEGDLGHAWALAFAPGNRIDGLTVAEEDDGTTTLRLQGTAKPTFNVYRLPP